MAIPPQHEEEVLVVTLSDQTVLIMPRDIPHAMIRLLYPEATSPEERAKYVEEHAVALRAQGTIVREKWRRLRRQIEAYEAMFDAGGGSELAASRTVTVVAGGGGGTHPNREVPK